MRIIDMAEFIPVRTVFDERFTRPPHDFEERQIGLYICDGEYYLLYWFDPLPGGYGENRCEGIVHITESDRQKDDEYLTKLYFDAHMKHLINISMFQKEMTLTCLEAAYCRNRTCIVWCASSSHQDRHAGCIEFTKDEMETITEEKLVTVLRSVVPDGTVIPVFRLNRA